MTNDELKRYFDNKFLQLEELKVYIDKRFAELESRIDGKGRWDNLSAGHWPTIPMIEAETGGYATEEKFETVPPPPKETEETAPVTTETPPPPSNPEQTAQAEALKNAAEEGKPFCEECEKAKDEIQVITLRSASESGAPFCEECEKAKQEIKTKKKSKK